MFGASVEQEECIQEEEPSRTACKPEVPELFVLGQGRHGREHNGDLKKEETVAEIARFHLGGLLVLDEVLGLLLDLFFLPVVPLDLAVIIGDDLPDFFRRGFRLFSPFQEQLQFQLLFLDFVYIGLDAFRLVIGPLTRFLPLVEDGAGGVLPHIECRDGGQDGHDRSRERNPRDPAVRFDIRHVIFETS